MIGVVGHRDLVPDELPAIRLAVEKVLRALQEQKGEVQIQLLSSMAEGADLLVADVARELGIEVIALLPFSAAQCRADLDTEEARATFDQIMVHAERLELPLSEQAPASDVAHNGATRDRQFQRAGAIIARYCSLLIAIWDGQETEHVAGTARVVNYRQRGIRASDEAEFTTPDPLLSAEDNDLIYDIRCNRTKAAATSPVRIVGFTSGGEIFGDAQRGLPPALLRLLQCTSEFNSDVSEFGSKILGQGRKLAGPTPYATPEALLYVDRLFQASDWLGVHFRRCFSRALAVRYLLWAVLAFLLLTFKKNHNSLFGLASITGVLLIFASGWLLAFWAHNRQWHRRFVDYRGLAEGLRVEFYWELAGVRTQFDGEFAHESFLQKQDIELEWIRAAMRSVGLRCALYRTPIGRDGFGHTFAAWVGDADPVNGSGQLQYYRQRTAALDHKQEIAEKIAQVMLFGGLALGIGLAGDAALRFFGHDVVSDALRDVMLWSLALLTVYGAIYEIYLAEKADRALIRQYRYMDALFSFAARELRSARSDLEKLEILRALGHACLAEHAQWILAHRDKRIEGMRW